MRSSTRCHVRMRFNNARKTHTARENSIRRESMQSRSIERKIFGRRECDEKCEYDDTYSMGSSRDVDTSSQSIRHRERTRLIPLQVEPAKTLRKKYLNRTSECDQKCEHDAHSTAVRGTSIRRLRVFGAAQYGTVENTADTSHSTGERRVPAGGQNIPKKVPEKNVRMRSNEKERMRTQRVVQFNLGAPRAFGAAARRLCSEGMGGGGSRYLH
ncbi:hypothetical protein B0H11DRAFT_1903540 [Mycena galericulata]|nr:hypothetical protein B0H11DRAFT_1903540 [Mycena galericulata]